jgi:hypothetical protein
MGAKRAGVVGVDIEPNVSQIGSKVEAAARLLKPLGLRVNLDNDFTREIEAGVGSSRRSLDSINTNKAQSELRQLGAAGDRELGRVESKAKLSSTALLTVGAGAVAVGTKIISGLRPAADAASDLNEAVAYGQTVFGDSFGAVDKFATGAAEKIGQSRREAIAGATDFATLGKAAGLAGDDLAGFSTDLVTLASDLASARNTSTADAIQAISAGLRGESEPLRRYGVLLDDASLRQEALALGIIKTTKEALTPQQKVLAAQSAIFKQTSDAQGDFARTSDGMANSQRIAAAEFENAKAKLGEGLTPVITGAAKAATTLINVLDKIPGGTEALGVGILGVGALSILGGAVTTITGLRRAFTGVKAEALETAAAERLVGTEAVVAGTKGSAALGKMATAAKGVGLALAGISLFELEAGIENSARGQDKKIQDSINGTIIAAEDGGKKVISAFSDAVNDEGSKRSFAGLWERFGAQFRVGGEGVVADIEHIQRSFDALFDQDPKAAQALVDAIREQDKGLNKNSTDYIESEKLVKLWQDRLDKAAKVQKIQTGATVNQTEALDQFGYAIDAAKSKNQQYSDSLDQAFAPLEAAVNAQDALADGQKTLADAQKKYQDIVNGNTDGLKSAAESLRSARDDLSKAVAETGPGSKAARDAAKDVRDALRAYRDLQVEIGKGPAEGDFFDPRTQDLQDAYQNIIDAQEKAAQIESGNSDQIVSARDRVTEAQKRYNEELDKTGPNSKEAADALEAVQDAERELPGLARDYENALRDVQDELNEHPEAVQASIDKVDEWARKGLISVAVAEAWKKELQEVKKAAEEIPDPTPPSSGQPLDNAPIENRPGGATRSGGSSGSKPAAPQVISDTDAYKIGISAAAAPSYLTDGDIQVDRDGRRWKYRQKDNRWVAQFHGGGLVGPEGGEAHEGEVVLNKSTVQKYGASNLLALQTTAAVPAAVAAALPTTSAAPGNVAVTADAPMVEVLLRILAALSQPGANNDMVAWLQAIEANTRRPAAGPSVESVQARTGAFV